MRVILALWEAIEHSENKVSANFKNEVGPGVLQQTLLCKKSKQQGHSRNFVRFLQFVPLIVLQQACLLSAGVEYILQSLSIKTEFVLVSN